MRSFVLAGVATAGTTELSTPAFAEPLAEQTIVPEVPSGEAGQIEYSGGIRLTIRLEPWRGNAARPLAMTSFFGAASPYEKRTRPAV